MVRAGKHAFAGKCPNSRLSIRGFLMSSVLSIAVPLCRTCCYAPVTGEGIGGHTARKCQALSGPGALGQDLCSLRRLTFPVAGTQDGPPPSNVKSEQYCDHSSWGAGVACAHNGVFGVCGYGPAWQGQRSKPAWAGSEGWQEVAGGGTLGGGLWYLNPCPEESPEKR